jgi:hypothetical protein
MNGIPVIEKECILCVPIVDGIEITDDKFVIPGRLRCRSVVAGSLQEYAYDEG